MGDRDAARFSGVFELHVAALLRHLDPPIPLKGRDYFSAIHDVYLYTLRCIVKREVARLWRLGDT